MGSKGRVDLARRVLLPAVALVGALALGWMLQEVRFSRWVVIRGDVGASVFYYPFEQLDTTSQGIDAGNALLRHLETGDTRALARASEIYDELLHRENIGGEYGALRWLCDYLSAGPEARQEMIAGSPEGRRFIEYFGGQDFALLKRYLVQKYRWSGGGPATGGPPAHMVNDRFLHQLIIFNSPGRQAWESSSDVVRVLDLDTGDSVADIGCGTGYFSFLFAEQVGEDGRVYAIDLNRRAIDYIESVVRVEGLTNVVPMQTNPTDIGLPADSLDVAFMCATYQTVYGSTRRADRERLVASILSALKAGGRLVVSDNDPRPVDAAPFNGILVARELVIGQLESLGLKLVDEYQFVPQRYTLVFKKDRS